MKIDSFEIFVYFAVDESISLIAGPTLREVNSDLRGKIIQPNIPAGAPPELPRFVIRFSDGTVFIGQNRFHLALEPPAQVADRLESVHAYVRDRAVPVLKALLSMGVSYQWAGVVANQLIPRDAASGIEAVGPVVEQVLSLGWPSDQLASFQLQVGRHRNHHLWTYTLSGYEMRSVQLPPPRQEGVLEVDLAGVTPDEVGFQFKVDVNNKPAETHESVLADLEVILQEQSAAFHEFPSTFGLEGIF